jgi:hypothetical protein
MHALVLLSFAYSQQVSRLFIITWSHWHTPQSIGLLWTRDRPFPETSTWQHKDSEQIKIHGSGGIQTHDPSKLLAADLRLRPRGNWDRLQYVYALLYCHLWPVCFHYIFPCYLINCMSFTKIKLLNIKCVFWLYLQIFSETFLILRRIQRDTVVNVHMCSCKVLVILVRF